ncbi:MAG: DoxX family protein [Bacteroidales bacterium]|jgi:putative oxidoreductase|nr:DoxX family protein [Bacteroidales bacterium]
MPTKFDTFIRNEDTGKLLLRISVGMLLLPHGLHKLIHGLDPIKLLLSSSGLPEFIAYGVPVGEVIAPLLLVLGLWSRIAGVIVIFTMLMTFFLALGLSAFSFGITGGLKGELNLLFLLASAAICFLGSGQYSVSGGKGRWD